MTDDEIVAQALRITESRVREKTLSLKNHDDLLQFLRLKLGLLKYEVFVVLFLDINYKLINHKEIFRGTLDENTIYCREIVREVLDHNACAIILVHNHPNGTLQASPQDINLTKKLANIMNYICVDILDHVIVTAKGTYSMYEDGTLPAPS